MAPPAPRCICQEEFLPPPDPMFPCWDIREGQLQKTVAYDASPTVLGREGQPADARLTTAFWQGTVLKLRRTMEPYVSFSMMMPS